MGDDHAHDAQSCVQEVIDRLVADGDEVGLQVAVMHRGELVVDAVSGLADVGRGQAVTPETLFFAASTAKGVASAVAHVLVERGELDYDLRLADVWPEFAAHGKGGATLRHVLMHSVGVPAPPYDTTARDLCDWDRMCRALADAEPWWEPGTGFGYHAQTFGFLLGETVRPGHRADPDLVAPRGRHQSARRREGRALRCAVGAPGPRRAAGAGPGAAVLPGAGVARRPGGPAGGTARRRVRQPA